MFNDRPIFCNKISKLDQKSRCYLPASIKIDEDELLVFAYNEDINKYYICSEKYMNEKINDMKRLYIDGCNTREEMKNGLKQYNQYLFELSKNIFGTFSVDKTGRFTFPVDTKGFKSAKFIGARDVVFVEFLEEECVNEKPKVIVKEKNDSLS